MWLVTVLHDKILVVRGNGAMSKTKLQVEFQIVQRHIAETTNVLLSNVIKCLPSFGLLILETKIIPIQYR
jgi:hypothetical protein